MLRCRLVYFSTTGSSSRNRSRSLGSGTTPPSYLCLSVSVNISVYVGDIKFRPGSTVRVAGAKVSARRDPAEQHVDAVIDELLAGGGQASVQIRGEQRRKAADQARGGH